MSLADVSAIVRASGWARAPRCSGRSTRGFQRPWRDLDAIPKAGGIDTMAFANQSQAFQDRKIDVGFYSGPALRADDRARPQPGLPHPRFDEAAGKRYVELLPGNGIAVLKGGTYQGVPEDVRVPYVFNQLVTARVPDDLVYRVTKLLERRRQGVPRAVSPVGGIQPRTVARIRPSLRSIRGGALLPRSRPDPLTQEHFPTRSPRRPRPNIKIRAVHRGEADAIGST